MPFEEDYTRPIDQYCEDCEDQQQSCEEQNYINVALSPSLGMTGVAYSYHDNQIGYVEMTEPRLQISNNRIHVDNCTIETSYGTIEVNDQGVTFNCDVKVRGNLEVDSIHFVDRDRDGNIQVVEKDIDEYIKERSTNKSKMNMLVEED